MDLLRFFATNPSRKYARTSYSQCGEDLIVDFIFSQLRIRHPSYIDVGAYHPYDISNTALFYAKGSRGVNIEPNPSQHRLFITARPGDINLNIGVGECASTIPYYEMSAATMNTFSHSDAKKLVNRFGMRILHKREIRVDTLPNIINTQCNGVFPDFLSLDVEGLDSKILKAIDYTASLPKVICVETITYSETGRGKKESQLIKFLTSKGYLVYADTYINTIFVLRSLWRR